MAAERAIRKMNKSYLELTKLPTFKERYDYLKLGGAVGKETFGYARWLNQTLYRSPEWKRLRNQIIARDEGCDLGIADRPIQTKIYIHHINPITQEQILARSPIIFDPNNLICVSFDTHQAIHYSDEKMLIPDKPTERRPNDTCPWRKEDKTYGE